MARDIQRYARTEPVRWLNEAGRRILAGGPDVDLLPRLAPVPGMLAAVAWFYLGGDPFACAHTEDGMVQFNNTNLHFVIQWTLRAGGYGSPAYGKLVPRALRLVFRAHTRRWLFKAPSPSAIAAARPPSMVGHPADGLHLDDVSELNDQAGAEFKGAGDLALEQRATFIHPDDAAALGFVAVDQRPGFNIASFLIHQVRCAFIHPSVTATPLHPHLDLVPPVEPGLLRLALQPGLEPGDGQGGDALRDSRVRARRPHPRRSARCEAAILAGR